MKAKLAEWKVADMVRKSEDGSPRYNVIVNAIDFVDSYERIHRIYHEIGRVDDSYCIDSVFLANSKIPGACDDYFARIKKKKSYL